MLIINDEAGRSLFFFTKIVGCDVCFPVQEGRLRGRKKNATIETAKQMTIGNDQFLSYFYFP